MKYLNENYVNLVKHFNAKCTIQFIKRSVKPTDAVGSVGCKRPLTLGENILKQGINILSVSGIESYVKQKRDEALPLGESMTPEAQHIASGVGG